MIKQFLNLSTVHVSPAARHWLEANAVENAKQAAENAATHPVAAFMHGWMMLIPSPEDWPISDVPADLQDVCVEAMLSGCDYVLFEANGDVYETLPTFAEPDNPGGDGLTDEERAAMGFEASEKPEDDGGGIHDELDSHLADGVAHGGKPVDGPSTVRVGGRLWITAAGIVRLLRSKGVDESTISMVRQRLADNARERLVARGLL